METKLVEEGVLLLKATNCLRCYTNKDTINDSNCSKGFKIQIAEKPTYQCGDTKKGENCWFATKRRQNRNDCRVSLSLSPFLRISLQTSILQLLLVHGMRWLSIPHRKTILVGHHLFNSGQEERRLIPCHFKKVIGERTSSLPVGRVIWPWRTSGSWDFLKEGSAWNSPCKNGWGKDVTARTSMQFHCRETSERNREQLTRE